MLVELKNVTKKYGNLTAVDDVSLTLERGKIIGLLGSNGSGKTTLIKLLNDLLKPTTGEVLINGQKPGIESKKVISYLPEVTYFNEDVKVKDAVKMFADFYEDFDKGQAEKLLEKFELPLNRKFKSLSKGTKEKVQLVLVMSRKADLYILDEPIGGVDPAAREVILDTILENFNKEGSILLSTHLISDIERILDDVIFISKGKITKHDSAENIRGEKNQSIDEVFREEFKC